MKNKIVIMIIILVLVSFCICNIVYANGGFIDDMNHDLYRFKEEKDLDTDLLTDKAGVILGAIQTIGTIISVGTLMVIGIKYMMGSIEQRAEYKKTFITYIIGAFLLFTVTLLPNVIYNVVHDPKTSSLTPYEK